MTDFMVRATELPENALLRRYAKDAYTDCFAAQITGNRDLEGFVAAFYTTWLFKAERLVLGVLLKSRSTDEEAAQLARDKTRRFAVWTVEERNEHQLLMCPVDQKTRSWLMVEKHAENTLLYFGSALLVDSERRRSMAMRILIKVHRLYSKALLALARRKLERAPQS